MSISKASVAYSGIVIDHTCTDLSMIPDEWVDAAKNNAAMYYGHTSHGGQLTVGLDRIESADPLYSISRSYWKLPDEIEGSNLYS